MRRAAFLLVLIASLAAAAPAAARDPGRWLLTGWSSVPFGYWQGVTGPPGAGSLFFPGPQHGLHRTRSDLRQTAGVDLAIPPAVASSEGYNHIGDPSFDGAEGGRVLLPLECYTAGGPSGGNTCGTGSIGVADPESLAFRYYVKLDPAEIPKAMWVESSPDGSLLWTSSGSDLLAYRATDVTPAAAAPAGAPIRSVARLAGAVPPSGVTGGAFRGGRLLLAGSTGTTYQIWSLDTATGTRRLELELEGVRGEAEGVHVARFMNGELHWVIAPALAGTSTFGPSVGLLHFARASGRPGLRVSARATRAGTRRPRVAVRVRRRGRPVGGARVSLADASDRTNRRGRATLRLSLEVPGTYSVLARRRGLRGLSAPLRLGGR